MNTRAQLICAHSALIFMAAILVGLFILPGWLPPPSPSLPADQVAAMFRDNPMMRVGMAIVGFAAPLSMGLPAAISVQLRRIEGPNHVFAYLQLMCGVVGVFAIFLPAMFWLAISYRPDTPVGLIVMMNDVSWFMIIGAVGSAFIENVAIGLAILLAGREQTIYPRWLGYWNIWLAFALMPGVMLPFFKTGAFAWNGVMGFWTVVTAFFLWLLLNYVFTVRAINRQAREAGALTA